MSSTKRNILSVLIVSETSYILQLIWINIVEPIMEACGVMFRGILPEGEFIGAAAIILINIAGAVILGVLYKGEIPVWMCLFYIVLYTGFLIVYSPGRIEFSLSENFFGSVPFIIFLLEIIPFIIARLVVKRKNKEQNTSLLNRGDE